MLNKIKEILPKDYILHESNDFDYVLLTGNIYFF